MRKTFHSPMVEKLRSQIESRASREGFEIADDIDDQLTQIDRYMNAPASITESLSSDDHRTSSSQNELIIEFDNE